MSNDMEKTKYGPLQKDFAVGMIFLWDIMNILFGGTAVWVIAKPYANTKNGRYVFFILNNFLIGLQYWAQYV